MPPNGMRYSTYRPEVGCGLLLVVVLTMCVLPYFVVNALEMALSKLHLWTPVAVLTVLGILLGSLVNIPLKRIERETEQLVLVPGWQSWLNRAPLARRTRTQTIIAVNVGGCVVPLLLAAFELLIVVTHGLYPTGALVVALFVNIIVCYLVARPIEGLGIAMPSFVSPVCAVAVSHLLLMSHDYDTIRAPVAFVAGVIGPVVGADLLHLRDITRISVGVLSIGGAGTFDGIVLSGMLAALLA